MSEPDNIEIAAATADIVENIKQSTKATDVVIVRGGLYVGGPVTLEPEIIEWLDEHGIDHVGRDRYVVEDESLSGVLFYDLCLDELSMPLEWRLFAAFEDPNLAFAFKLRFG